LYRQERLDLLVRSGSRDSAIERRHTLIKITEPAFQVADKAERILTQ